MADRSGRLSELLTSDRVVLPLQAGDKPGALAELTRTLFAGSTADYGEVLGALARVARILRHEVLRERLSDCRKPDEFHRVLALTEAS